MTEWVGRRLERGAIYVSDTEKFVQRTAGGGHSFEGEGSEAKGLEF